MLDVYSARLFACVNNIIRNEEQAKEIVNDCFVTIHRNDLQFDAIQKLEAYLFISARNAAINFQKKNGRDNEKALSYAQLQDTSANIDAVTEREIEHGSLMEKIYQEIHRHPPLWREIFELFYFDRKSAAEIAAIKGISIRKVYSYKDKLLKILREKFGPDVDKLF